MDDYHSWMYLVVGLLYLGACMFNIFKNGFKKKRELKDSDFSSDIMVCEGRDGRAWLYRRKDGKPLPPPNRIITNGGELSWEECWIDQYGKDLPK